MNLKTPIGGAVAATLALALPGSALAHDHGDRGRGHDRRASDVPSRVAAPLKRTLRSLERAEERIEDGEADKAVAALTATRRNLSASLKAAKRRLSDEDTGPASAEAVASVQHDVVDTVGNLYDGQDGSVVEALDTTLVAAVDSRDAIGTAVSALGEDASWDYEDFFAVVADDTEEELATIAEIREDDTVPAAGDAVLAAALTKITATHQAATSRLDSLSDEDEDEDAEIEDESTDDDDF